MLFNHFEILSVLLAPSHLMPLFGLGLQHGLVLDCGDEEATLIPVYQGVPILKAWQALPLASKVIRFSNKNPTNFMARVHYDVCSSNIVKDSAPLIPFR